MKYRVHASCSFSVALLLAALLTTCLQTKAARPPEDNREVTQLLEDIQAQAADLQRDSDELESFSRSQVSWESHATELEAIKERINKIGQTIQKLQGMRDSASPWQQEAIDRIIPVAQKLASNTNAAIERLNRNRSHLQDPQYQEYLKSNADAARALSSMVRDFVDYGKTRSALEKLEKRLEVASK
jgi:DNA repair exonuclease SbcCD ATPase subunit